MRASKLGFTTLSLVALMGGCGGSTPDDGVVGPNAGIGHTADRLTTSPAAFPVENGAGYPFSPECYEVSVASASGSERYAGRIKEVIYAFTTKTQADYLADNNVPWENSKGQPGYEAIILITHKHDGGYKGSMQMVPPAPVTVPAGRNLVFKLHLEKFGGVCGVNNDTVGLGDGWTKAYFVEVTPPQAPTVTHVQATSQAWVDKLGMSVGSHGSALIKPYIKVNLSQLDGAVAEVAFRMHESGVGANGPYNYPWNSKAASSKYGNDYFGFELMVSSDFHTATIEGKFFVRTDKGTHYWIGPRSGANFVFDSDAFHNIQARKKSPYDYDWDPSTAVPTQTNDRFGTYYNPYQMR